MALIIIQIWLQNGYLTKSYHFNTDTSKVTTSKSLLLTEKGHDNQRVRRMVKARMMNLKNLKMPPSLIWTEYFIRFKCFKENHDDVCVLEEEFKALDERGLKCPSKCRRLGDVEIDLKVTKFNYMIKMYLWLSKLAAKMDNYLMI